jgi:hypothetical protein
VLQGAGAIPSVVDGDEIVAYDFVPSA